jgi:2',3'-cyclic-nucleotide 2'-phosphodiesterase (5'-nucleotidase family)
MTEKQTEPEATYASETSPPPLDNPSPVSLSQVVAFIAILLGLLGAVLLWYWRQPPSISKHDFTPELVIIQLNDTYRIDALSNGDKGGLGRVATLITQTQQQNKPVIVVHAGDFIAPSLESNFFQGLQMIAALNYLDSLAPMYVVPGNHEFDAAGPSMVVNALTGSNFSWLASNLTLTSQDKREITKERGRFCADGKVANGTVAKCVMLSAGKLKLGIFALTLHGAQDGGDQEYAKVSTEEKYQLSEEALTELLSQVPKQILAAWKSLERQPFARRETFIDALKEKIKKDNKDFWQNVENDNDFWLSINDDQKYWDSPPPEKQLPQPKEKFLSELGENEEFWSSIADAASQSYVGPAEKAIQQLEGAGANVIIGLTHLDMADDKQIARLRHNHPGFIWIAGGHEHYAQREGLSPGVALITKADSNARSVWKISIGLQDGQPQIVEEKIEVNKDTLARDPRYEKQIADDYNAKLKQKMNYLDTVIGDVQDVYKDPVLVREGKPCFIATEEVVRNEKSDWGSYLADRMRHAYPKEVAQIGVINGGGIRIDDEFCGKVSYEQLERSIGFPTRVIYVKLKGSTIEETLEHSVGGKRGDGRFLQVSGIRFEFSRQKIPGRRVSNIQVQKGAGWQPLNPNKEYSVAVSDFLLRGRDGYKFHTAVTGYFCPGPDLRKLVLDSFNSPKPKPGLSKLKEGVFELPAYARARTFANVKWKSSGEECLP